jgi:hypothetical protein
MLALLNPFRSARARSAPRVRPSFRPRLEILEDRTCPSGTVTSSLVLTPTYTPSSLFPPSSAQPVITLAVQMNGLKSVTLSGMVMTCGDPGRLAVTFTGVVNATTFTLADGSYSLTIDANGLGEVDAQTVDQNGNVSNVASAQVASAAPAIINLTWTANSGSYILSGQVTGPNAAGMQVTIWGQCNSMAAPVTVTCDSSGYFAVSVYMNSGDSGFAFAQCTDCWGQQSNAGETQVFRM